MAGEATVALGPDGLQDEVEIISTEDWYSAWARTCKGNARSWKSGGAGIRWLFEEQVEAIGTTAQKWLQDPAEPPPAARAKAHAVFPPKARSTDIEAHRPVVLSLVQGWVSRAILQHYEEGLQPRCIAAEGFVKGGSGRHISSRHSC